MKKIKLLTAIATAIVPMSLFATSCGQSQEEEDTNVYRDINLDEGWTFRLNDQETEQTIDLPHDFSIIQPFDYSQRSLEHNKSSGTTGFLPGGIGYYHKNFILPRKKDATVILNFDGAYNDTIVTVNGQIVGNNKYGYNPFAFDISNYVVADGRTVNKLDVIVKHEHITSSRWYPGSGIYRDVKVSVLNKIHIAHNGTYVTTPNLKQEAGNDVSVNVEVDVQNSYDESKTAYVKCRVIDAHGTPVSDWSATKAETISKQETHTFSRTLKVNNPNLWSADNPNLYYVETQVVSNDQIVDQYKTRFGFRYFEFGKQGFFVNGQPTKLLGVCLHHDQGALGAASYNDAIYRQLTIMKEMGMNAVRTSHNCPDEDFLRMCDELGLYVMDEAFDGWEFSKTSDDFGAVWKEEIGYGNQLIDAAPNMQWHSFVMQSMVKRDRNCPSIFMWSLGNELHEGKWHDSDTTDAERDQISKEMVQYAKDLKNIARRLDHDESTARWCGTALESDPNWYNPEPVDPLKYEYNWPKCQVARTLYENNGVIGLNYGEEEKTELTLSRFDRVYGSETASAYNSRGFYGAINWSKTNPDDHFRVSSYDTQGTTVASEALWRTLYYDGYGGQFVWTGFDYIGEPSPYCWNCEEDDPAKITKLPYPNSSYYGIVDTCGFPKDSYYLYRSHLRQDSTTTHLVGSLNPNNMYKYTEPESIAGYTPIDIYTNAPWTLIKRNGEVIARVERIETPTSSGSGFYNSYELYSIKDCCKAIQLPDTAHKLYTRLAVQIEGTNEITAEACNSPSEDEPIEPTFGLSRLEYKDDHYNDKIEFIPDKTIINADGKSLVYITVNLLDSDDNLVTDYTDRQKEIEIIWTGPGEVIGVDNGDQATDKKFQNPEIYRIGGEKLAKIMTYAGKALIIVRSGKTPGTITLKLNKKQLTIQTI